MRKTIKNSLIISLIMLITTSMSYGQLKPVISSVTSGTYVLVTKENVKFEKPNRAVQKDFKVHETEAFDPNKMGSYAKWKVKTVDIKNTDGTTTRHIALLCLDNNKYLHQTQGMVAAAEYDKFWEKDANGQYKIKDNAGLFKFLFIPEIKDETYIWLRYFKDDKTTKLVITPSTWNTRSVKLVLYKM